MDRTDLQAVIDALSALDLWDSTVVMRTADHGELGGSHGGLRGKGRHSGDNHRRDPGKRGDQTGKSHEMRPVLGQVWPRVRLLGLRAMKIAVRPDRSATGSILILPPRAVQVTWPFQDPRGEVPEWSNGTVSKTVEPLKGSQGSNPCLSATLP